MKKIDFDYEGEEEPIEDWDKIRCKLCGKKISMLDGKLVYVDGYEHYICKGCAK